jgi:signal transduction histidine kinase
VEPLIEAVQVSLLLRDAAQSAKHLTAERIVAVESDEALWVNADYGLLMRALGNLIENAARYSPPGGAIRLGACLLDGRVHLMVRETRHARGRTAPHL